MKVRGGEFSTGTMGNFQPELTVLWAVSMKAKEFTLDGSAMVTAGFDPPPNECRNVCYNEG